MSNSEKKKKRSLLSRLHVNRHSSNEVTDFEGHHQPDEKSNKDPVFKPSPKTNKRRLRKKFAVFGRGRSKSKDDKDIDTIDGDRTRSSRRFSMPSDLAIIMSPQIEGPAPIKPFDCFATITQVGFVPFNKKKVNQDRCCAFEDFNDSPNEAYFGVFDGHGHFGEDVSGFVKKTCPLEMLAANTKGVDPAEALVTSFRVTSKKLLNCDYVDSRLSGTTAIVTYQRGKTLYTACTGDSRAIIGRKIGSELFAKDLSKDQKPDDPEEKKRIEAQGGRVEPMYDDRENEFVGPYRVWLKREEYPGLAMSRSFGDQVAHSVGVISQPVVTEYTLQDEDRFLILASDGVWEFITSEEAVKIVGKCHTPQQACEVLLKESRRRWKAEEDVIDDTTIIVVYY